MVVLTHIADIRRYRRKQEELIEEVELSNKLMTLSKRSVKSCLVGMEL
jgi:hypothetical protein